MVRHRTLTPVRAGSIPATPTISRSWHAQVPIRWGPPAGYSIGEKPMPALFGEVSQDAGLPGNRVKAHVDGGWQLASYPKGCQLIDPGWPLERVSRSEPIHGLDVTGSMTVSKTVRGGSNPSACAKQHASKAANSHIGLNALYGDGIVPYAGSFPAVSTAALCLALTTGTQGPAGFPPFPAEKARRSILRRMVF